MPKREDKKFLRLILEVGAIFLFCLWLKVYNDVTSWSIAETKGGSDLLLAFILMGIHGGFSLGLILGGKKLAQLLWSVLNLLLVIAFISSCVLLSITNLGWVIMILVLCHAISLYFVLIFILVQEKKKKNGIIIAIERR